MKTKEIQQLFQEKYNRDSWKKFLGTAFSNINLYKDVKILTGINSDIASETNHLGFIHLDESGIDRNIAVYEVILADKIILERNRVALRNLLRKHWKDLDGAFIVYHHPQKESWRFTYVSELTGFDAEGEYKEIKTEPKRYTYMLGESESCKTVADRFSIIANKGAELQLDDIKEAFSVEKLSNSFFDDYKEHYEKFVEYLTGKRMVRVDGKWEETFIHAPHTQMKSIFNGNDKEARDFIKKMLGRIVFLFFIQKKGWLGVPKDKTWGEGNLNYLQDLFENSEKESFYNNYLTPLFYDTLNSKRKNDIAKIDGEIEVKIPYLNGGLFQIENEDYRLLDLPKELFQGLFDFFAKYNFTIYEDDPNDHTVAVDPEMLGHIFENLLEDNKDKGAFYTPPEIVHYMCRESLIEYLVSWFQKNDYDIVGYSSFDNPESIAMFSNNEGRVGQAVLEVPVKAKSNKIDYSLITKFINKKLNDTETTLIIQYTDEFNKALDNVKICDPAIGSGAFPMGLLKEIFSAKQDLHQFKNSNMDSFNGSDTKLNIIQNSLYGVDIEKGAVDIARLRFWLSIIVDEETPQPLPNLDYKIVVGDSLISRFNGTAVNLNWSKIGSKYIEKNIIILKDIVKYQKKYFSAGVQEKSKVNENIRELKVELVLNQLYHDREYFLSGIEEGVVDLFGGKKTKKQLDDGFKVQIFDEDIKRLKDLKNDQTVDFDHFDWKLDFPEVMNQEIAGDNVGFDIVIGNPPYIQIQKFSGQQVQLDWENAGYETFERTGDIYQLFYEKGNMLLKENGKLCFITSNKWMRANYGKSSRKYFSENTVPKKLIDFGGYQVFDTATVDSNILLFEKIKFEKDKYNLQACTVGENFDRKTDIAEYIDKNGIIIDKLSEESWTISGKDEFEIKKRIEEIGTPIKEWDVSIYRGVLTGCNEAFIISGEKKDELIAKDPKSAEIIKPVLRGRNIKRYKAEFANEWLINSHNGYGERTNRVDPIDINEYPAIKEQLDLHWCCIEKRGDKGVTPYNLRNCAYYKEFEKEKIIYPNMTQNPCFSYSKKISYFSNDKSFILTSSTQNIKYLLGYLNSKISDFLLRQICSNLGSKGLEIRKVFFENLPIPKITNEQQVPFERLVDMVLYTKENNLETESSRIEAIIDLMVFDLYFETEMKEQDCYVTDYIKDKIKPFKEDSTDAQKLKQIKAFYDLTNSDDNISRCLKFAHHLVKPLRVIYGENNG